MLTDGEASLLSRLVKELCSRLPMNSSVLAYVMNEKLKAAGSEHQVSRSYVKSFVKGLGLSRLSYRKNVKRGEVEIDKALAFDMSMNLVHKAVYLMSLHAITKDRVFNVDETSTKLLPFSEYGFVEKNSPETR
eukprot:268948-Amphidinium_carterae.1